MYKISSRQLEGYKSEGYLPIKTAEQKQFLQVINISGNALTYTAYTADGETFDQAIITKDFETGTKRLE